MPDESFSPFPIVLYGHPILRRKAEPLPQEIFHHPAWKRFVQQMYRTMQNARGVGLAGPQLGLPFRFFWVDTTPVDPQECSLDNSRPVRRLMVNPTITWRSAETNVYEEGCLSLPGIYGRVRRPAHIRIQYIDGETLEFREEAFFGFPARVIQHEYDHLEGILFPDHLSTYELGKIREDLQALARGKVSVFYPVTRTPALPEWVVQLFSLQGAPERMEQST